MITLRVLRRSLLVLLLLGALVVLLEGCENIVQLKGQSMEPTLQEGEKLTVDYKAYANKAPGRQDIVVFEYKGVKRVSRIIGLPGDTIELRGGRVYVNGNKLEEPYLAPGTSTQSRTGTFQVPEDAYFVMGDNREHSNDSREIGTVPRTQILGRIVR